MTCSTDPQGERHDTRLADQRHTRWSDFGADGQRKRIRESAARTPPIQCGEVTASGWPARASEGSSSRARRHARRGSPPSSNSKRAFRDQILFLHTSAPPACYPARVSRSSRPPRFPSALRALCSLERPLIDPAPVLNPPGSKRCTVDISSTLLCSCLIDASSARHDPAAHHPLPLVPNKALRQPPPALEVFNPPKSPNAPSAHAFS